MASCGRNDETLSHWGLPVLRFPLPLSLPSTQSGKKKKKETRQNCTTNDGPPSQLNSLSDDSSRRPSALRTAFLRLADLFSFKLWLPFMWKHLQFRHVMWLFVALFFIASVRILI